MAATPMHVDLPRRKPPRQRVLEQTLRHVTAALQHALFADELSRSKGLFQALDPRVKVVGTLGLLLSVALSRSPWILIAIYLLAILLAWRSAVSPILLLGRVWKLLPFFTIPMVLPALFITPGPEVISMPLGPSITRNGLVSAMFLLLRASTSLTLTLLLIYTTSWNVLLAALTSLRLPPTLALMLGMTYRYIFLLLRLAADLFTARQSRVVGSLSVAEDRRLMAAAAGTLLEKSLTLGGEVHLAMESRGFRVPKAGPGQFRMGTKDWLALIGLLLFTAGSIWLGREGI